MRELGLFSARRLMGQLSQLAAMTFRLRGWYKEFTKEKEGEGGGGKRGRRRGR
jgi:hypothetical protein